MPTTTPAKPNKATWEDWVREGAPDPHDDLITRDQLLDLLHSADFPITPRELQYWETAGALPRAVKRSHMGAIRALYPAWILDLVPRVRELRRQGLPLREIGAHLQNHIAQEENARRAQRDLLFWRAPTLTIHRGTYEVDPNDPASWAAIRRAVQTAIGSSEGELAAILDKRAHDHEQATGRRVASIDIIFRDEERRALVTMTYHPSDPSPSGYCG